MSWLDYNVRDLDVQIYCILLNFASIFDEARSLSVFKLVNFFLSKINYRVLVFIFLIAHLDDSLDF